MQEWTFETSRNEFLPENLECKNKDLCNGKNITEEKEKFQSKISTEASLHLDGWKHVYYVQCLNDKDKNH